MFETFPLDISSTKLFLLRLPLQFVNRLIGNRRLLSSSHDVDGSRWAQQLPRSFGRCNYATVLPLAHQNQASHRDVRNKLVV